MGKGTWYRRGHDIFTSAANQNKGPIPELSAHTLRAAPALLFLSKRGTRQVCPGRAVRPGAAPARRRSAGGYEMGRRRPRTVLNPGLRSTTRLFSGS